MSAHDMKNPVITAGGFLSRLLPGKTGPVTEPQASYLNIIKDELQKIEELISDFLEFSRFEATEYRPLKSAFNIEEAVRHQIEIAGLDADKKNIQISFDYPDTLIPVISADGTMIERVTRVSKHFNVPTKVVVNKFDVNQETSDAIRKIYQKEDIEVLAQLPFSQKVSKSIVQGVPIVEFCNDRIAEEIFILWERIKEA